MKLRLDSYKDRDADVLIKNVSEGYTRIFANHTDEKKRAIYRYFFSRNPEKLPPSLRTRLINLYDPLANRSKGFPDGLRYCLNIYTGCSHACSYCYVNQYSQSHEVGFSPHCKDNFEKKLLKDIGDLKSLNVPAAPLHISNSTDPLQQELEIKYRHTLFALQKVLSNRVLFNSVVMLTKNPSCLCEKDYLNIITDQDIKPFIVQVTCSFYDDKSRSYYEPMAPSVKSRLEAIKILTANGIDVELRIDPLFPSSVVNQVLDINKSLPDYDLIETQSTEDLEHLVEFAKEANVKAIIGKPLKVPMSRNAEKSKRMFYQLFKDLSDGKISKTGRCWRLPQNYQEALIKRLKNICNKYGLTFRHCKHDVLTRK